MRKRVWWVRERPGLYYLEDEDGTRLGIIERGGETWRWWWDVWGGEHDATGLANTLREAKDLAVRRGWSDVRRVTE